MKENEIENIRVISTLELDDGRGTKFISEYRHPDSNVAAERNEVRLMVALQDHLEGLTGGWAEETKEIRRSIGLNIDDLASEWSDEISHFVAPKENSCTTYFSTMSHNYCFSEMSDGN